MSEAIEESVSLHVVPPVSGFWRRVGAFAIDGVVLGVTAQLMVWAMASFWFRIGPYGRFVGALMALAYFAVLNSRIGGGQTIGKRLLGIAVVGRDNQPIGLGRSIARTLIWLVPMMCNNWSLPLLRAPFLMWLVTALIFGVGGALAFTMIFNRRTRQGLHDLVCDTFVVRVNASERIAEFPRASRMPWVASAIILAIAMIAPPIATKLAKQSFETLARMVTLQELIQRDTRFFSVSVLDQTFTSGGNTTHMLNINAWYKGRPSEDLQQQLMNDIAKTALQSLEDIDRYDRMMVSITSAYDLGIAKGHITHNDSQPIHTWRERALTTPQRAPARG